MMRSDSDLDETDSVCGPPTPDNNEESCNNVLDEPEEKTEPTTEEKSGGSKKEWRKLWRSQKTYWRERENEKNNKFDERDEAEQDGGFSRRGDKEAGEEEGLHDSLSKNENEPIEDELSSTVVEDLGTKDSANEEPLGSQSPKHGWRLLKRLQQKRAQAKEKEQDQTNNEEDAGNEDEESALWRDILFTIGSLTDDENGVSTDEDFDKSLDDIEEQILRQAGIENNSEHTSGAIPPSPWSSLKRLRDKIKENSTSAKEEEEEVDFIEDDEEEATREIEPDDDKDKVFDESRDEITEAPTRVWPSLKRFRGRIKESASTDKEEQNDEEDVVDENPDDSTDDDDDHNINGEESLESPSPWISLKRLRYKIKENSDPEGGESDKTTDNKDENEEERAAETDEVDIAIENSGEKDGVGDETNTKRWGVLNRLRKKLDADSDDSIEDQIEFLAKELEKEQQRSRVLNTNETVKHDLNAEDKPEEDQETNKGERKGWTLFKRVQDRLTAEKTVDDETYGYENVDEAFAFRTFHILHTRNQELEDLVERLQRANEILKAECKLNTVKVTELTNMIEMKEGNVAEDVLLHKSIENAELLMQVDELQVELDKANSSVQSLKVENREHKRLVNGMGRILDALHSTHVGKSSAGVSSMGPSGELSIDNLEPKIERIMQDREHLVLRCKQLEQENEMKDEQIEQLSEALDAQSLQYDNDVEKVKEDDQSTNSELTRSTYTGTSISSSSIESDDNVNSRLRNLYNSVSSKMISGNMESVQEDGDPYFDTKTLCAADDDVSSVNAIQGHNDDLESIKKRLNTSDPKYVEFLSLMGQQGMMTLESVPSGEAEERPSERPEQEITNSDEIICELVI